MPAGGVSPVLTLVSPGAGPVELERGGTLVFVLLLGFFSMFVSVQREASSSGQRANELSSIKQKKHGKWAAVGAAQAAQALIHFCQTRRPHHGDILTTKQIQEEIQRHDSGVSTSGALLEERTKARHAGPRPLTFRFFLAKETGVALSTR